MTDSITSSGLEGLSLKRRSAAKHHRFKRGYRNVINEAVRLNGEGVDCPLAIETSGHAAMQENYFLDDGAYLVTKIIIKLVRLRAEGKTLEDLLAPLAEPAEALELRFPILDENFRERGEAVIGGLDGLRRKQAGWTIAPDNCEGIRISLDKEHGDGWFLLRLSVHDPIMPLNAESDTSGRNVDGVAILNAARRLLDLDICLRKSLSALNKRPEMEKSANSLIGRKLP